MSVWNAEAAIIIIIIIIYNKRSAKEIIMTVSEMRRMFHYSNMLGGFLNRRETEVKAKPTMRVEVNNMLSVCC